MELKTFVVDASEAMIGRVSCILEIHDTLNTSPPTLPVSQLLDLSVRMLESSREVNWLPGVAFAHHHLGKFNIMAGHPEQGLSHYEQAAAAFRELKDFDTLASVLGNWSSIMLERGDFLHAEEMIREALTYLHEDQSPRRFAQLHAGLASIYAKSGRFDKASEYFHVWLSLARKHQLKEQAARALSGIAALYRRAGDLESSLKFAEDALEAMEGIDDPHLTINNLVLAAATFTQVEDFMRAHECLTRALNVTRLHGIVDNEPNILQNLAMAYKGLGRLGDARVCMERSIEIFTDRGNLTEAVVPYTTLARLEREAGNVTEALELMHMALEVAKVSGSLYFEQIVQRELVDLHGTTEDYLQALEHYDRYHHLCMQSQNEQAQSNLQVMQMRREADHAKAEAEIEHLRADHLQLQLDTKQRELAAQAMHLARQTEMLGHFRNDLRAIVRDNSEPLHALKAIREKLKELPCEAIDWTKFEAEFQGTYPEFRSKLLEKVPDLTKMEVKICSMLKLRLTSADIAKLFCLSERSVENHRYNIRKKLDIGRVQDIHEVLAEI